MLQVPGASAQSTSPFGVCRMRRAVNCAVNAPVLSVGANPLCVVSQSLASPELVLWHSAKPTLTLGVKPVPETVTVWRCTRSVDGVTVTTGFTSAVGASAPGALAVGSAVDGSVVAGASLAGVVVSGVVVSGGVVSWSGGVVAGSVDGGVAAAGAVVVGGASSANAGAAAPTNSATTSIASPAPSPRRRMM